MVDLQDIQAAQARIKDGIVDTPFRRSQTLSEITGADIWIKFENYQFTASFKERGAGNKLHLLTAAEKAAGVIAMSAGNHAQGVAYMARELGIPATIVMPETTPFVKVKHTRDFGARVILHGQTLVEAAHEAQRLQKTEGLTFVHPYDDADVIAGQGTIALEMLAAKPDLDCLVIPVGGGGLIAGCAVAAQSLNSKIEIFGVETDMYPGMTQRLAGQDTDMSGVSLAEGIAVKSVGEIPYALLKDRLSQVLVVSETAIEQAINVFLTVEKTVAEGAGAAGLAGVMQNQDLFRGKSCGLVLCGGNIDQAVLASVIMRSLVRDGRLVKIRVLLTDRPGQLARVSEILGQAGANIVEVQHQRLFPNVSVKQAELDVLLEARDQTHMQQIIDALRTAAFTVRVIETDEG